MTATDIADLAKLATIIIGAVITKGRGAEAGLSFFMGTWFAMGIARIAYRRGWIE